MKYKIIHETNYQFSDDVFLEPHYLRLKPQTTPANTLESFNVQVSPTPTGISEHLDAENNQVQLCWFDGMQNKFTVVAESVVAVKERNPFNFILYPAEFLEIPFQYSASLKNILSSALAILNVSDKLLKYSEEIIKNTKSNTVDFLTALTKNIHADFTVEYREVGSPFEPDKTFELKKGSCRDIAWMQIQLLRQIGIAARFVSGYFFIPDEKNEPELHGWLEAYLPGAGWIGLDPSHGILTGNAHIPVASSSNFEYTMPVTGKIRGSASSVLSTKVNIILI